MKNYLPLRFYFLGAFLSLIAYQFSTILFLLIFVPTLFVFFIFKQKDIRVEDFQRYGESAIFSPLTGTVLSIKRGIDHEVFGKNQTEIRVMIKYFDGYHLFFPFRGEVSDTIFSKGRSLFREKREIEELAKYSKKEFLFKEINNQFHLGISLIRCSTGLNPMTWIEVGDIGGPNGCFGIFPLGGTVVLYLDESLLLRVREGDFIHATQSPLASKATIAE